MANNAKLEFDKSILESVGLYRRFKNNGEKLQPSILNLLQIIDREDFCSRYELENLPSNLNLTSNEIFRMLYYKYALAFAKLGDSFYILPYTQVGQIDVYARTDYINLIPYTENEKEEKRYKEKSPLSSYTFKIIHTEEDIKEDEELKAVIIKDYINGLNTNYDLPRYQVNSELLEIESFFIPYCRTALKLSTGVKMIAVNDADESEDVIQSLTKIDDCVLKGTPFIPVTRKSDFQDIGTTPTASVQDYFLAMQSVDNFRLATLGLSNGGLFQKQERETISEQATNTVNASARLQNNYEELKRTINLINKAFNLNINVKIKVDFQTEDNKEINKGFENGQYKDVVNNDIIEEKGVENV